MKKLLGIVVLGLLLSCSEKDQELDKSELIENCADEVYSYNPEDWYELGKIKYTDRASWSAVDNLKTKLTNEIYTRAFAYCENLLEKNPITFKEKYN